MSGLDIVPRVMRLHATVEQVEDKGKVSWSPSVRRGSLRATRLAGLLALVLAGSLLASTGPAVAASPLSWSSPTLIDSQSHVDGVSCLSSSLCVAVDRFGNVIASTDPAGGQEAWSVVAADTQSNVIVGISCVAGPLCVAVDRGGDVVVSTDPTGGASQWQTVDVDGSDALVGVSCVAGPLCVAVDEAGNVVFSTNPTGGAGAWTVTHVDNPSGFEHLPEAVSCASVSLCVVVDDSGYAIASTEPTQGEQAWTSADIDRNVPIFGISCSSSSLCVATDGAGHILTSNQPAGGMGAWSSAAVSEHPLGSVSCSSESLCVTLDGYGDVLVSTEPTRGAGAWSAAHVDPGEYLWGVSCTTGLCVAVDGYGNVLTSTEPAQGVSSWASARVDDSGPVGLRSVSCASNTMCLVADQHGDVLSSTDPMSSSPAWTIEDGGPLSSYGVSCASRTFCVTTNIGNEVYWVSTSSEPAGQHTWIEQGAWSYPGIIIGRGFGPSGAVSCPSSSLCVADMDSFNDFNTLATSTDPAGGETQWHTVEPTQIKGSGNEVSPPYYADPILSVSCASQALCVAVDAAGNVLASTNPASNESTWTISPADTHLLDGISCPSASFCVAVDNAGDVITSSDPAASTPTWTVSDVDGGNAIAGVSCTSESLCVAVDATGNVLASTDPAGGAGAWSAVPVDSGHALTSVSCVPEDLCVAVDNTGYAVTGTFSPPTEGEGGHGGGESKGGQTGGTTTSTGPSLPPPAVVSGVFSVSSVKVGRDGQIELTLEAPAAGSIDARATVSVRKATAGSRKRKTMRARKITYGTGSATVPEADRMTVTLEPTKSALSVLKSSRTLRVPLTVVFHPRSGSPATVSETVTVRYQPPRRSRACSASKAPAVGSGERSRSPRGFALAVLALGSLTAGCGAAGSAAQAGHAVTHDGTGRSSAAVTATPRSVGLTVTLTATPMRAKPGSPVESTSPRMRPTPPALSASATRQAPRTSYPNSVLREGALRADKRGAYPIATRQPVDTASRRASMSTAPAITRRRSSRST